MNPTNSTRNNMGDGYGSSTFSIDPTAFGISEGHCFKTWCVWIAWSVSIYFVLYWPLSKIIGSFMNAAGAGALAIQIASAACCWPIAYLVFRRVVKRLLTPLDKRRQQGNPMAEPLMVPPKACLFVWVVYTALNCLISFILGLLTGFVIGLAAGNINPIAVRTGAGIARLASLYLTFRYLAIKMLLASVRNQMDVSSSTEIPSPTPVAPSPQAMPQSNESDYGIAPEVQEPERMESPAASPVSENVRRVGGDVFLRKVRLGNALEKVGKVNLTASEKEELARIREEYVAGEEAMRAGQNEAAAALFLQTEDDLANWQTAVKNRQTEAWREKLEHRTGNTARPGTQRQGAPKGNDWAWWLTIAIVLLVGGAIAGILWWQQNATAQRREMEMRQAESERLAFEEEAKRKAEERRRTAEMARKNAEEARQAKLEQHGQSAKESPATKEAVAPQSMQVRYAGETKTIMLPGGVTMEMVWCPPGTFTMGSNNGGNDEKPPHRVTLTEGFWMARTEVTQKQWKGVMGNNPSNFKGDDLPVESVSWDECVNFCRKAGNDLQLPTEAQWEYACRAETTGDYAGNLEQMTWYGAGANGGTHPVGRKQPNAWGLYDMHGNVWEWCADRYGAYLNEPVTNPIGPDLGEERVCRGGGWVNYSFKNYYRSAHRGHRSPISRIHSLGFRPVMVQP